MKSGSTTGNGATNMEAFTWKVAALRGMTPQTWMLSHEKWQHYGEWRHKHGCFHLKSGSTTGNDATNGRTFIRKVTALQGMAPQTCKLSHKKWQHYGE